jgi:class 3 adenylate cyclase
MLYDYKDGKQRVQNILNSDIEVEEVETIPKKLKDFTYDNAKVTWISAIFVDLRDSTDFLENGDKEDVTKLLRSYSSEIIQILNSSDLCREIGVRGDCVYGIFSTPKKKDIKEVLKLTYWINTYMEMLNKLLKESNMEEVKAGIGMSTSKDLIAKVGRKGTGINDRVWIGNCVAKADKLSKVTNKGTDPIAINSLSYSNSKDVDDKVTDFFSYDENDDCYFGDVVMSEFNDWINDGMNL